MRRLIIFIFAIVSLSSQAFAGDIYVSVNGNDNADGSKASPFLTLKRALREAREWRRLNDLRINGGINIILEGGIYRLSEPLFIRPEDSGTPQSPTVITSAANEKAHLSGGYDISGWKKDGNLWVAKAPVTANRPLIVRQLWVNRQKALLANQCGLGKMERMIDFNISDQSITIPSPKQEITMENAPQLEMMVHQRWATAMLRVKSMTRNGDKAVVRFMEPESSIEFSHPWPQPIINGEKGSSSFSLMNAKQFVDEPGEWYQDYATGEIYYYPRMNESINDAKMTVSTAERLLTVMGSAAERVHDITFKDVIFEYSAWNRPSECGNVTLQGGFPIVEAYKLKTPGLPWSKTLENQAWIERPLSAVNISWADNVDFIGCDFNHLSATALDYSTGDRNITVSGNRFNDIGGTAMLIGSFAEGSTEVHRPYRTSPDDEEYCEKIIIKDNKINDATNEDWGCVGIGAGFVRDATIEGNEVSNVNYSGICVGWGWNTDPCGMRNNHIKGNYVHQFAKQLYDAGGIYTLSNQPNSSIEDNVIDSLGAAPYATNDRGFYIYLDEATDGYTISNNWCPKEKFGDNKPGPKVVWKENGPKVKKHITEM
jgi:hypothetical protein